METKHKEILQWLAGNKEIRESLAAVLRNNSRAAVLDVLDPARKEQAMDAKECATLRDLVLRYGEPGPAAAEFDRCIYRLNWRGREAELGKMPLTRNKYTARQLFNEITDHQRMVDGLPMG